MNGKIFTLRNLYQSGTEKLEKAGIREAKLDAWYPVSYTHLTLPTTPYV